MGVTLLEINNYTWLDDHTNHMNIRVHSYQWQSYAAQTIVTQGSGLKRSNGQPTTSYSWINYTLASAGDSKANCRCMTESLYCYCDAAIEGGTVTYGGYDYWRNMLVMFYSSGYPVYFEETVDAYIYDVVAPWDDQGSGFDRFLNYTSVFEKSTGYLRQYSMHGTEWCCKTTGCPNEGIYTCDDGSELRELYAEMSQFFDDYQIIDSDNTGTSSWPIGFLDYYPPAFPSVVADLTCTASDDNNDKSMSSLVILGLVFLPVVSFLMGCIITYFYFKKKKDPLLDIVL
jgi:hypothetical protein